MRMLKPNTAPRLQDLTVRTLSRTNRIAGIQFPPDALALKLQERLTELLEADAAFGLLLDIPVGSNGMCLAASAWVFVDDETCQRFRDVPIESLDDWIVSDVLRLGTVQSSSEIARRNASEGLHMLILYFQADDAHLSDDARRHVIQAMMADVFPRGYNLRTLTGHVRYRSQVSSGIQAGTTLLRPERLAPGSEDELPLPALLHVERTRVPVASWIGGAFVWSQPRFRFSPAEQRSLMLALRGLSDDEIATECGISRSTVKKRWDSIFGRVAEAEPEMFDTPSAERSAPRRGREKRSVLLQYLSTHPEELRPYG
jgi:DNA-binding CsgD family transcriptional regulator